MSDCNIQIYGEIGSGRPSPLFEPTVVYKARIKDSIEFVVAKSVDISRQDEITNAVKIMRMMHHQNIVEFNSWFQADNRIYVVLEYCPGGCLADLLERDVRLPESIIRIFCADIVAGLLYLHKNSVYFCDFDAKNFFLDENGIIKLGDFARSVISGERANLSDIDIEYLEVLAPEIIDEGVNPNIATDFYALGCLIYKMAGGSTPFASEDQNELTYKIRNTQVSPLPFCSQELNDLVFKLVQHDPAKRLSWKELIEHPFWRDVFMQREDYDDFSEVPEMQLPIRFAQANSTAKSSARSSMTSTSAESSMFNEEEDLGRSGPISFRASRSLTMSLEKTDNVKELLLKCTSLKQQSCVMNQAIETINLPTFNANAMPVTVDDIKDKKQEAIQTLVSSLSSKDAIKKQSPLITFLISSARTPEVATGLATNGFIGAIMALAAKSKHPSISAAHCVLLGTIAQYATEIDPRELTSDKLQPLEKLAANQKDKVKRKAISAVSAILSFAAVHNVSIPDFIPLLVIGNLKSKDATSRHYALKAATNVLLADNEVPNFDLNVVEQILLKFDASDNQSLTESYALALAALYRNGRKPQSTENISRFVKGLIVKLGATTAVLGIVIAAEIDMLASAKDEIIIAFNKGAGELRIKAMLAICDVMRQNPQDFMQISDKFFGYLDRLQYDSPQVYENVVRWFCAYADDILEKAAYSAVYPTLQIIVDSMHNRQSGMRVYRPRFDRRLREVIKNDSFSSQKSDLLLEIAASALFFGVCDPNIVHLLNNAVKSPIKEVRFASMKIIATSTSPALITDDISESVIDMIQCQVDSLLNDEIVIADTAMKVFVNLIQNDEESIIAILHKQSTMNTIFQKIGSSSPAVEIAALLMKKCITLDQIVANNYIPLVMKGMDSKDTLSSGVSLLLETLKVIDKAFTAEKDGSTGGKKIIKSVSALSTMAPKCASLVLEYNDAAEALKILIKLFTPLPGQKDVVIESAFQPFAQALVAGHQDPKCSGSLRVVIEELKKSAKACSSMKLKIKGSSKLMSAMKTAAASGTAELRKTTESALNVIKI